MGDVGTALSNVAGGIGSALSGVGSAFSGSGQGGGGGGIGDAISSMFSGSAAPGQTTDPAQSFQQAVDPTGSVAASEAINPPGAAPSAASSQGQGGQQAQPPPKPAAQDDTGRQGALDEIRKLLTGQARGNPYQTGGGGTVSEGPIQDPLMPSPPLGAAGRIDTSGIPPRQPGSSLGLTPGEANEPPAETQGALARSPRAASAGQNAVSTATQPEGGVPAVQQPEIGPGSAAAAGGVPALASALARGSPLGAAAAVMQPTPAETGELPATAANIPPDQRNMPYPGQQYAADPSLVAANPPAVQQPSRPVTPTPGDRTPIGGGEGNKQESPTGRESDPAVAPLSKKQYEDVLKGQGVSASEAKKRADASTPADRARAAGAENLPTKKPSNEPYYQQGGGPGTSNITRDRAGMQGVPAMLGQLAQLAMPLIGMAMSGGLGGGGGRGRFHGRGFPWG
ncbi:MAG TPA: hypothetical protein VHT52_12285, partial [Stellaceae bacterium]|nr:hypothetical protein [Stellaceae bacterium]